MIIRRKKVRLLTQYGRNIFLKRYEYRHVILLRARCHASVVLFSR